VCYIDLFKLQNSVKRSVGFSDGNITELKNMGKKAFVAHFLKIFCYITMLCVLHFCFQRARKEEIRDYIFESTGKGNSSWRILTLYKHICVYLNIIYGLQGAMCEYVFF
jgi:hypothetical protein